jgi:hypothetical protein
MEKMPAKLKATLEKAMRVRAKAKALEDEAKVLKRDSNDTLLPLMMAHNLKDYSVEGLGKVIVKTSSGSSIDKKVLIEQMLLEGVNPNAVNRIVERSSRSWSTDYVEFKRL